LTVTAFLKRGGIAVSNDKITREYRLEDVENETDVVDFVATLPETIAELPFGDFSAKEIEEEDGSYDLTVTYGPSRTSQKHNTVEYKFSFQAPSAHIYQSLATIATYFDEDVYPFGAPNYYGAINVVTDGGKDKVEGIQLPTPTETFKLSYVTDNSVITPEYQRLVRSLCGKVNSDQFRGEAAGSIMLVRCDGGRNNSGTWNIDFGFGYSANVTNLDIGANFIVEAKDGWDLLWCRYRTDKDATAKTPVKRPCAGYVERVYERADLNLLNLP
jgi:hypothetical protein